MEYLAMRNAYTARTYLQLEQPRVGLVQLLHPPDGLLEDLEHGQRVDAEEVCKSKGRNTNVRKLG
jgi:hypothetical protein